jgi:hypothetical protein
VHVPRGVSYGDGYLNMKAACCMCGPHLPPPPFHPPTPPPRPHTHTRRLFATGAGLLPSERAHFGRLVAGLPISIERTFGPAKGVGVRATRSLTQSQVVFSDAPLVAMQHGDSEKAVIACGHCGKFVGTVPEQLAWLATPPGGAPSLLPVGSVVFPGAISDIAVITEGTFGCVCGERYCSEECQRAEYATAHWLLCPTVPPGVAEDALIPQRLLVRQARATNEVGAYIKGGGEVGRVGG